MNSRDFAFWLQGFFEIHDAGFSPEGEPAPEKGYGLSPEQTDIIRRHLAMVFKHEIDPSYGNAKDQEDLQAIHDAKAKEGTGVNTPFVPPTPDSSPFCPDTLIPGPSPFDRPDHEGVKYRC